jgi:hypothetical protein
MAAMWHCSVEASSLSDSEASRIYPEMPANRERIASSEGARGVETLYMTETMQINRKTRATANRRTVSPQAPIDGSQ